MESCWQLGVRSDLVLPKHLSTQLELFNFQVLQDQLGFIIGRLSMYIRHEVTDNQ